MANRRFGGGGPQRGGPRGFAQNANVNPWQGNNGPSMGGPMGDNQNLQARLALALTRLLQTPQVDPPSLLSLNTSPGHFNQDFHRNGGRRDQFRRNEPYNKNQRGGWRVGQGGGGGGNRGHQGGGPNSGQNRNNRSGNNKSHQNQKDQKFKSNKKASSSSSVNNKASPASSAAKSDKEKASSSASKDEKAADIAADENRDEDSADTKRDWKEEKNTGDDGAEKATEEVTSDGEETKKDTSKYAGLPNSLFHCFVCNKSMWDGDSYKNHIRGKAHVQMLNSLDESFQITVKILRENMRLAEEKKMIEWNRMMRNNRKHMNRNEPESHCNMCDLKFMGKIIGHRKTEGHQRLKRFLHPNCDTCNLEFPSRMEWVEHRFTPEHLFKLKEVLETKKGDDTEGHVVEEDVEWDNDPILQESLQCEDDNPVLELDDDLANLYNRVPNYRPNRPVGTNSMVPVEGFFCEVCKKFLRTETDSQNHLKSEKHYHEFVSVVKDKFRAKVEKEEQEGNWKKKKAAEAEANEQKEEEEKPADDEAKDGGDMYDPEEACKEGAEGDDDVIVELNTDAVKDEDVTLIEDSNDGGEEEAKEEEKGEAEEEVVEAEEKETSSPTTRRRAAVRNGAGPKSKKARKA